MQYLFIILILLDQIPKVIVRNLMSLGESINLIGNSLKFTYFENTGIAFGMFADTGNKIILLFLPFVFMIILSLFWFFNRKKYTRLFTLSVVMILSGGISNGADRLIRGSVTDFIDVNWFAIFNIADIWAVVGCILLLFSIFFCEIKDKNGNK